MSSPPSLGQRRLHINSNSSYLASLRDEKKFDVQEHVNIQNDRLWLRKGEIEFWVVTRRPGYASVMVWEAVTDTDRSLLVFLWMIASNLTKKMIAHPFLSLHCCPRRKSISKTGVGHSSNTLHQLMERKQRRND